jgi:hypothetical protein
MASSMATTSGPARASRVSGTAPMRPARPLTWDRDSSAEASSTSAPVAATEARTWKRRVDLPTPGGPKTRVTEPETNPPPRTRSTSTTPVDIGWASAPSTWRSETAIADPGPEEDRDPDDRGAEVVKVFHCPQ